MSRVTALSQRFTIGALATLLLVLSVPERTAAQGQPAVVEGTTQLFIRRGPGREFPPFATLTGGSRVRVQEKHGSWARVTTASGQVGYVHTKYLRVLEDEAPDEGATPAAAEPTPAPASTNAVAPTAPPTATPGRRGAEVATAPSEPTSTTEPEEERAAPTPTETRTFAPAAAAGGGTRRDLDRLTEAVEALNRRLDQRFPLPDGIAPTAAESATGVSGGAVLLGLVGVIVGWFLGATYQRNKERGRRSRIRL